MDVFVIWEEQDESNGMETDNDVGLVTFTDEMSRKRRNGSKLVHVI